MYDFVIVGAGPAGCVLAHRLSADPNQRVLLLEAGPRDWHPFIHMPAGIAKLVGMKGVNWDYYTEPESALEGRRLWWPRGKVLGGSSSINAMCYIRGHALDYDEWARAAGDPRWAWSAVLPYFKRAEHNSRGGDEFHGAEGPLYVSDHRYRNPLSAVFVAAARELGCAENSDFNGQRQEGFGYYQVLQRDGARASAASTYLAAARDRPNLEVVTRAFAEQVLIEGGRAVGVRYRRRGRVQVASAARAVLLAGGAVNSPQLLMLSGIGPADQLRAQGIEVVRDAPEVGRNLQDHLDACTLYQATQPITYDRLNDLAVAWRYYVSRSGPGTSNIAEAGGFARSALAPDQRPDLQFHFVPAMLDDHGRKQLSGHGFTVHACGLRPKSRGHVELASPRAQDKPRIHANYLSDPDGFDLKVMVEGVRWSRGLLGARAFAPYRGAELFPGADAQDDAALATFIRRKAETIYHPVGTCRMGRDAGAVVDPELRVHGIEGLRVIDASVMPTLIGGNTNAPVVMIAERASELLLAS